MKSVIIIILISSCLLFSKAETATSSTVCTGTPSQRCTQTGTIAVTGCCYYWYNTTHVLPITNARIDVYDNETTFLTYLGSTYTNYTGYFIFGPISNNDGPGEDGLDIIVVVAATSSAAKIINSSGNIYAAQTPTYWNCSDGTLNVGNLITPYNQRGAWWIFCYHFGLTHGWKYLFDTVNYNVSQVTARWPYENASLPHYHTGGEIHLPDWSCWWPDVMIHEYAHYVMYRVYGFIPPSMSQHSLNLRSNATTAWAEGWANFYPLVVFNDPVFTWSNGTHYANINLETPTWYTFGWDNGDEVEGHVAGALWDIYDSANDSWDTLSDGFAHIRSILSSQTDNTFHEFWQAWCTSGYKKQLTLMAIFQNSIDYRGAGDVNGDGTVDIYDSIILSAAYGSHRGEPSWDQRADLNYDDSVDIIDANILAQNFGHTYGC